MVCSRLISCQLATIMRIFTYKMATYMYLSNIDVAVCKMLYFVSPVR